MRNHVLTTLLLTTLTTAIPLQKRVYVTNTRIITEIATVTTIVTLHGQPVPSGATAYSPEELAQLTQQNAVEAVAAPSSTSSLSTVDYNTVSSFSTIPIPGTKPPPTLDVASSVVPVQTPVAQPPPVATAPVSVTTTAVAPSATGGTGGTGGANPFFPNGPKVGETAKNVRLSPFLAYWTGASIENHIGACGHVPYLDTDPQLAKSDSKGDKKFMFHPPVISGDKYVDIFQYCGAILEVTGPDGLKTTGTVVDLCEDCGGPGGIDMMKANWEEVGSNVADGDCVFGASWKLTGWIKLLPALSG